jgi:hypothetical protein
MTDSPRHLKNYCAKTMNDGTFSDTLRPTSPEQLGTKVVSSRGILLLTRLPAKLIIIGENTAEEILAPLARVRIAA